MKISLLKFIDRYLGRLAVMLFKVPSPAPLINPRSLLIIRPGGIGDAVLVIPAIYELKKAFPHITIDVLAEKRNASAFILCPFVNVLFRYDSLMDLISLLGSRYDVVIDTEQWHRLSAVIGRLMRAPAFIGFGTNERKRLFTHAINYCHEDYESASFCNLLAPLGITEIKGGHSPYLTIPGEAMANAEKLLSIFSNKNFVVIFPGSSISEKRWGQNKFTELILCLLGKNISVVIVGVKEDFSACEKISKYNSCLNLVGVTTLIETAAIIYKGRILVSGDSGILHLGAGLGKPTVSLFGPSNVGKWAPRGVDHIVIRKRLPCSPCSQYGYITKKCTSQTKCMADISVKDVAHAVETLLAKQGPGKNDGKP